MNAPSNILPVDGKRAEQALLDRCRDKQWKLLQSFARLEIALHRHLSDPPKTFGAKIRAWIKQDTANKKYERLIPARNLLAHAAIRCVRSGASIIALWEVADGTNDLNCAKFDQLSLEAWADDFDNLLKQAIAAASTTA